MMRVCSGMSDAAHIMTGTAGHHEQFRDGVFLIRGESVSSGVFKGGKFESDPFLRFLYRIESSDRGEVEARGLRVALTVPWKPGWAPCEISFKTNVGSTISEFEEEVRTRGLTTRSQRRWLVLERFRDVIFEAEVRRRIDRKNHEWFDVWQLRNRRGMRAPAAGAVAPRDPVAAEISVIARRLGLGRVELSQLCQEQFAARTYADLPVESRVVFRDWLKGYQELDLRHRPPDEGSA